MLKGIENLLCRLLDGHHRALIERIELMSAALDRLTASVTTLSTSVDAAVAKITALPGSDDTAVNALADTVDGLTAKLDAAEPAAPAA